MRRYAVLCVDGRVCSEGHVPYAVLFFVRIRYLTNGSIHSLVISKAANGWVFIHMNSLPFIIPELEAGVPRVFVGMVHLRHARRHRVDIGRRAAAQRRWTPDCRRGRLRVVRYDFCRTLAVLGLY